MLLGYNNFSNLSFSNISNLESSDIHKDSKNSIDEDLFSKNGLDFEMNNSKGPTISMDDYTFKCYNNNDYKTDNMDKNLYSEIGKSNSEVISFPKNDINIRTNDNKSIQMISETIDKSNDNKMQLDNLENKAYHDKSESPNKDYKKSYTFEEKMDGDKETEKYRTNSMSLYDPDYNK